MPLQTVEPLRLYRQIAGQIATLIDNGEFPAGSRLPAERELATLLGVSRTSVREAIISLEIAGRVEVRVGTGHLRRRSPARRRSSGSVDDGPEPVRAARGAPPDRRRDRRARRAHRARRPTSRRCARRSRACASTPTISPSATPPTASSTCASPPPPATARCALVVEGLWHQRRGKLWSRIEAYFHTQKIREATLVDHAAIIDALEARDADGARAAMHRHLARVEREFQRRWDDIVPGEQCKNGARRTHRAAQAQLHNAVRNVTKEELPMKMQLTRIAAALAAAAICLPAAAKEFRSSDVHPEDYPTVMAVKYMSDIIKQKTGGKDSIKVYTA